MSTFSGFLFMILLVFSMVMGFFSAQQPTVAPGTDDPDAVDIGGVQGNEGVGPGAVADESGIEKFVYSYDNSFGGGYAYTVEVGEDGSATLSYESGAHYDYGTMSCALGARDLETLENVCLDHGIAAWDGFNRYNSDVCDGDGFYLGVSYADGGGVHASGSNAAPEGFGDFADALDGLFEPYVTAMLEEARQAIVDQGVSGSLCYASVTFTQQGTSGDDSYQVYLSKSDDGTSDLEVRGKSVSGEFFEKGAISYSATIPSESIDYDALTALVQKYGLMEWYGWDKSADDYSNSEWFQLYLGFDEGSISAYGTLHPENYDAFRSEFLTLIAAAM